MSDPQLLEQIADQAEIVRRLHKQYDRADAVVQWNLTIDVVAAEKELDRLLARRRGAETPLFGEE